MILKKVTVKNYRSIELLGIDFIAENKGFFGFLGINEAGKSNLLKAISIKDNLKEFTYEDSRRKEVDEDVEVIYEFKDNFPSNEIKNMLINGRDQVILPEDFLKQIDIQGVFIKTIIEKGKTAINKVEFKLGKKELVGWSRDTRTLIKEDTENKLDLGILLNEQLTPKILELAPKIIFWKSEDKYLMNNTINLAQFKSNPLNVSVPLKNCFELSGYKNILEIIDKSNSDPAFKGDLYEEMSTKVTDFVNKKWVDHKVILKFEESGGNLNFFVKDIDGKRQTMSSRSEGFKQFISFLLSSSAEVENGKLENSIIVIDEPETHLHPTSQEDLLKELIKISKKNILLFATHSSYLIDKENFSDYYNVLKKNNLTDFKKFEHGSTTFSEINYVVFGIPTTDYHNELIGWIQSEKEIFESNKFNEYLKLNIKDKKSTYVEILKNGSEKSYQDIALSLYIRNQIHHPENNRNTKFTKEELSKSISELVKLKENIVLNTDKKLSTN